MDFHPPKQKVGPPIRHLTKKQMEVLVSEIEKYADLIPGNELHASKSVLQHRWESVTKAVNCASQGLGVIVDWMETKRRWQKWKSRVRKLTVLSATSKTVTLSALEERVRQLIETEGVCRRESNSQANKCHNELVSSSAESIPSDITDLPTYELAPEKSISQPTKEAKLEQQAPNDAVTNSYVLNYAPVLTDMPPIFISPVVDTQIFTPVYESEVITPNRLCGLEADEGYSSSSLTNYQSPLNPVKSEPEPAEECTGTTPAVPADSELDVLEDMTFSPPCSPKTRCRPYTCKAMQVRELELNKTSKQLVQLLTGQQKMVDAINCLAGVIRENANVVKEQSKAIQENAAAVREQNKMLLGVLSLIQNNLEKQAQST